MHHHKELFCSKNHMTSRAVIIPAVSSQSPYRTMDAQTCREPPAQKPSPSGQMSGINLTMTASVLGMRGGCALLDTNDHVRTPVSRQSHFVQREEGAGRMFSSPDLQIASYSRRHAMYVKKAGCYLTGIEWWGPQAAECQAHRNKRCADATRVSRKTLRPRRNPPRSVVKL
jgi:hypothetical protein